MVLFSSRPDAQGLYDPRHEHDSCGVGAVAHVRGERSHAVVRDALAVLHRLDHRGAEGSEPTTGDGAGILLQVPDALIRATTDLDLPAPGHYATGLAFVPVDDDAATKAISLVERIAVEEELEVLGWREVPVDPEGAEVGSVARGVMPRFVQVVVAAGDRSASGLALDRLAWVLRKRVERESAEQGCGLYLASLSSRTMTYKGMLTTDQLPAFFGDLRDERLVSAIAIVHSRFSTNTFPSWPLAHPYRAMAHNGEFNTIRGNRNRMRAREALLATDAFPGDLQRAMPICPEEVSDSASFDEVLELLALGGRPLPHAVMMMMPEAWENHAEMPADQRDFYRFHAGLMEPWDGPAAVVFSDGALLGATLDRNGLRPARWWRLADDRVVLASESGVLDVEPSAVVAKGRLRPGRMFLVDTEAGEVVDDEAYKSELAAAAPYGEWLRAGLVHLDDLPAREHVTHTHASVVRRQQTFGYTEEDLRVLLAPMASTGAEPLGSMGTDTPSAALSARPRLLYDYFVQLFAQVTNPPLDAIREELVTCMARAIGPEQNLFHPGPASCRQVVIAEPVISTDDLAKLIGIDDDGEHPTFAATVISGLYPVGEAVDAERSLAEALDRVRREASAAIAAGRRVLVLSDRDSDADHAPIPSLLLTSAVHHHLVATRERTQAALVVESGDAREVHHVALLLGYGAAAVNPYLAFESIEDMIAGGWLDDLEPAAAIESYRRALVKGVRKVMSKMGISTVSGYTAAQAFEAVGLSQDFVDEFFFGTSSKLGGGGLDVVAAENGERHRRAYPENPGERAHRGLDVGGEYAYRREGELHLFTPENVFLLQHATRTGQRDVFRRYTDEVDRTQREGGALRGLMRLRTGDDPGARPPVPLDEVEPVSAILTRFATGGMSWGSISEEAHTDLAVAMNRLGGRSNTGEGGENPDRLHDPERRSAIKQVASGRFGVTSEYLVNAEDLQIKMAQGAKPGEGGQLAGNKVHPWIANVRHSTPGVGLISPPPHHDIYSIEDLKQLIHDLKNANEHARIHTKLVSSVGVGTVAAGVAKAKSDVVLISGWEGGTGAAALTSLKHTGAPWEVGLADAQQTLILNGLRDRITVQVDGQLKTGRDVVVAMLLGAEEFGFGTAPLVVSGCIMMRVCHLDTCPVGVATQNPELRARYSGRPEFVENFFRFVAEQVREYLAELGFRTVAEAVGHAELLDVEPAGRRGKAEDLDLSPLFVVPEPPAGASTARRRLQAQDHGLDAALDRTLLPLAEPALRDGSPVRLATPVRNVHRTVGTMLGAEITRRHGGGGLPDDTVHLALHGSGGQSLGAFLPPGMTIDLVGDANDYLAKGLSGGRVIVRPHPDAPFLGPDESHTIAGNVIAYGATGGEVFLRGTVGERFCVRNSGALAVVEGVGDHACEYMTGGRVVVLGPTGRNLGAGMSGGIAYVLDLPEVRVNPELVALQTVGDDDADWLREVVGRHRDLTGSPRAAALLDDWDAAVGRFTTVMPTDFRRVLEAAERARAEGLDPDDAVMEVAGG